ncbi:MAG: DNA alkylation repair protein [Bacteroidota bacterium]
MHDYLAHVKSIFETNGDPDRAQGQMRYMRHKFEYYGLKAIEWMALSKQIFQEKGIPQGEDLKTLARLCFEDDHREIHYFALEMVQKVVKKQPEDFIDFLEEIILTKSWWDTVDWISNKMVGAHFQRFPHLVKPVTERWMASGNIWLQRVCLIFQLTYKAKTDEALLFDYVLRLAPQSKEFFIQKGAGWALRQHSKINPAGVAAFIEANPHLPALTKREGMRLMKNCSPQ